MKKIIFPILILFTLFSCVDEFQSLKQDIPLKSKTSKSLNCKYWFKVTYDSLAGIATTSQEYVYTTCVDSNPSIDPPKENENYSNLYASSGLTLPTNPAVDEKYEYTGPEGDYVKYTYTSDSVWRVIERIIPMLVVKTHPDKYVFLNVTSPFEGQVIFGLDDLYYTLINEQWYGKRKQ